MFRVASLLLLALLLSPSEAHATDTDGDGFSDDREIADGTDPNDPEDPIATADVSNDPPQSSDQPDYRWLPLADSEPFTQEFQHPADLQLPSGVCSMTVHSQSTCDDLLLGPGCFSINFTPQDPPDAGFECCGWQGKQELADFFSNACDAQQAQNCPEECNGSPEGPDDYCVDFGLDCSLNGDTGCDDEETRLRGLGAPDCCFLREGVVDRQWSNQPGWSEETPVHTDADLYPDQCDNCPLTDNPLQEDADGDLRGDACDSHVNDPELCADTNSNGHDDCCGGTFDPDNDVTNCPEPGLLVGLAAGAALLTGLRRGRRSP